MAGFPHLNIDEETRTLMADISTCRDDECAVTKKHPFYPTPDAPPFFYGKRPCMPVVPTYLQPKKVMIIGEYPNCRFGTVLKTDGNLEKFIPVADINEPFEGGRYYDGHSIRDYPTNASLKEYYLDPLELTLQDDIWLTNVVKCYLMRKSNVRDYADTGWDTPPVQATFDDYLDIARVCVKRHLIKEVQKCQPKLIIVLGEKAYRTIHAKNDFQEPAPDIAQRDIVGKVFSANIQTDPLDKRDTFFLQHNIVHLYHPSFFIRGASQEIIETHRTQHIVAVKDFLTTLDLG